MKKIALLLAAIIAFAACDVCVAQTLSKKELKQIEKDAKNMAKDYEKEGWKVSPGAMPIQRQLEKAFTMQYEKAEDGEELYIMGNGQSIGKSYDAAKKQAVEMAKQEIISKLQSEMATLVESSVSNEQLDSEDAESITRVISESSSFSKVNLGRVITATELYRDIKGTKNKEVLVRVGYNYNAAMKAAKQAIREDLEKRGEAVRGRLNDLLK